MKVDHLKQDVEKPYIVVLDNYDELAKGNLEDHKSITEKPSTFIIVNGEIPKDAEFLIYTSE